MHTAHQLAVFCNLRTHKHLIVPATEVERMEPAMNMTGFVLVDDVFNSPIQAATVASWFDCPIPVQAAEVHHA